MAKMRGQNILVVDDDEAKRYTVRRLLQQQGYEVTEATTGQEALEKIADRPSLVVLDIKLPDINGLEICRRIKSDPVTSRIPVLQLSATYIQTEDKVLGLESGADAYLTDIVNASEMVATVRALLRVRQAEELARVHEERFRFLVQNVKDYAIFMLDADGRITTWNEGVQSIFGYTKQEFVGQHATIVFTPEDIENGEAAGEIETAAHDGCAGDERWHVRKDGSRFFASGILTALRDEDGDLVGFAKVMRDVTDRKLIDEERQQLFVAEQAAREKAEAVNRMKDEFLANLSHELRTPLSAITGWSRLLRSGSLSKKDQQHGLEVIERNSQAQAQLIEDLLDISRIISGKLRLSVRKVELAAIVRAAIETVKPAADAKGIVVDVLVDPLAKFLSGDADRLQQVAWNLLSNAIKFTPPGGRVEVRVVQSQDRAQLTVRDTGKGISHTFLPHVFDRFRQADGSTTRSQGGLGLGLAIVRQIVEMHGGTVMVESGGANQGSTFTVELPIGPALGNGHPSQMEAAEEPDLESFNCPPAVEGTSILAVDDEPDMLSFVSTVLEVCGARVTAASSVSEGMELLKASRPDIIITDIGMPEMDGFAFLQQISAWCLERDWRIPVIALTAYAGTEDEQRVLAAGFDGYVRKPVDPAELLSVLAGLVDKAMSRS